MERIEKKSIDWQKTGINLRLLRNDNIDLRRYVCFILKNKRKECSDVCESCKFKMDNNVSRQELAEVFNVSESVIYNWENGKTPVTIEDLMFYAKICKIGLEDILCFE